MRSKHRDTHTVTCTKSCNCFFIVGLGFMFMQSDSRARNLHENGNLYLTENKNLSKIASVLKEKDGLLKTENVLKNSIL